MRTYRVTVRGRFDGLSESVRAALFDEVDAHDAMQANFTADGTFTYDRALNAFSFRYVLTDDAADVEVAKGNVLTQAELNVTEYLSAIGCGFKALRFDCTSVDDVKASTRRVR